VGGLPACLGKAKPFVVIGLVPVIFSVGANLARKTLPWPSCCLRGDTEPGLFITFNRDSAARR